MLVGFEVFTVEGHEMFKDEDVYVLHMRGEDTLFVVEKDSIDLMRS